MKKPLLLTAIIFSLMAYSKGQTTLTEPSLPAVGTTTTLGYTMQSGITPGVAGSNKTWDFSYLSSQGDVTVKIIDPSAAPDQSKFSQANFVTYNSDADEYDYYLINSSGFYGLSSSSTYTIIGGPDDGEEYDFNSVNSPSDLIIQYPTNYNTHWISSYSTKDSAYKQNGVDYVRQVTTERDSTIVDGWGTIITPEGTYNNVLRVVTYSYSTTRDDDFTGGTMTLGSTISGRDTSYAWYENGNIFPLLEIDQVSTEDQNGGSVGGYTAAFLKSNATGILNPLSNKLSDASAFPNPSKGNFTISNADKVIKITNSAGKEISFISNDNGNSSLGINMEGEEPGLYFVSVQYKGQTRMVKVSLN